MSTVPAPARGLLRATLTLVAGGAAAQAAPLLLGPVLTRLVSPAELGTFHLFSAVAANLAVVACARYEFALPMITDDDEAQGLRALCLRVLAGVTLVAALAGAGWAAVRGQSFPLWLPAAVAALGALSLATLWATRTQRFTVLSASRVVQYGGGALGQVVLASLGAGVHGLIGASVAAAAASAALLRLPLRLRMPERRVGGAGHAGGDAAPGLDGGWRALARRHRDFPLLNTPHAFLGALQDTAAIALVTAWLGPMAAGFWGLSLRYLKAPATLVGGAVSQALYPKLAAGTAPAGQAGTAPRVTAEARAAVRRVMAALAAMAAPLVLALWAGAPWAFSHLFGPAWHDAGLLARALAVYVGVHFVAAPLAVVTLAWGAQAWALRLAVVGQVAFVGALAAGLAAGGLATAGWAVSAAMTLYFGYYFWSLATWPLTPTEAAADGGDARRGTP